MNDSEEVNQLKQQLRECHEIMWSCYYWLLHGEIYEAMHWKNKMGLKVREIEKLLNITDEDEIAGLMPEPTTEGTEG